MSKCEIHRCTLRDKCYVCGAPVCCPECCKEATKEAVREYLEQKAAEESEALFRATMRRNGHYK